MRRLGLAILVAALLSGAARAQQTAAAAQRLFTVDDLFDIEATGRYYGGPYAFSADEQKLAFTRIRSKRSLANFKWEFLWWNAGADVWVQPSRGASPVNITNGASDGSGWWSPQWSPDGSKLAMLSTRGGNVCLWVWDGVTRRVRQLATRNVDLVDVRERPYVWIDARQILVPLLPAGQKPTGMMVEIQTPAIASAAWPKTQKGQEATASVLESGVPVDLSKRPQSELVLVDVASGSQKVIVSATTQRWDVSPNRTAVAFTRRHSAYLPKADELLPFGNAASGLATVEITKLDGTPVTLQGDVSRDVLVESLRWSPDGSELAFFGYAGTRDEAPRLYVANVPNGRVTSRILPGVDVTPIIREEAQIEWTGSGQLLVRGAQRVGDAKPTVTTRRDWWLVNAAGGVQNLTAAIDAPPRQLWPQTARSAFVGVGGGELWRVDAGSAKTENLTAQFGPRVANLVWPAMTNSGTDEYRIPGRAYDQVIFTVQDGRDFAPYLVDLKSPEPRAIARPAPNAGLTTYAPQSRTALFLAEDRTGLRLWRENSTAADATLLFEANTFLEGIAEGEFKQIEYTSLNGEKLKGWLILPARYEAGRQYPLITWVYAGAVYSDRLPSSFTNSIAGRISLNMQIPAARGYVVLLPSMPLEPEGITQDPMLRLTEGVLPAVDKVIEMGIADPKRLFVMGQSFGGFSTYGLVTQTNRFAAAVSLAGLSDLVSLYGQFDARMRYTDYPQENLFQASLSEGGQIAMGNPPWKDFGRYMRNSPIFYVDRVRTPLLIIQGDMDYVALQQGEEFFMALYRQGKRASFVRYWGEGHVLESPANIRDMWNRIFAWLEEFSSPKGRATTPSSP